MDANALVIKLLCSAIGALATVVGILWREQRRWQIQWQQEHDKRIADLKEHDQVSAKFLLALERLQSERSEQRQFDRPRQR